MKNPKQKGAEFERTVCKKLSMWASGMLREDLFWRSAMSGGRATFETRKSREQKGKLSNQAGDVSSISEIGMPLVETFFLEAKHYADLKMDGIVYGATGELRAIWEEPLDKAKMYQKIPLVIAKENFRQPLLLTNEEGSCLLSKATKEGFSFALKAYFPIIGMHVFLFRDLLGSIDYNKLCSIIKANKG